MGKKVERRRGKEGMGLFSVEKFLEALKCNWLTLVDKNGGGKNNGNIRTLKLASHRNFLKIKRSWINKINRSICHGSPVTKRYETFVDSIARYILNYGEGFVYENRYIRTMTRPTHGI